MQLKAATVKPIKRALKIREKLNRCLKFCLVFFANIVYTASNCVDSQYRLEFARILTK